MSALTPPVTLLAGDCRTVLATLPPACVQTVCTSPPYFGLRDYQVAGQIGLEATVEGYVAELVSVFQAVRRVLRDDGTLWLNLGDSFSGDRPYQVSDSKRKSHSFGTANRGVRSDVANCLQSRIEGGVLCITTRCTLTASAQSQEILGADQLTPDQELPPLLGVQRVTIKQRDNDLGQVLYLLHHESRLRILGTVNLVKRSPTDVEIILDPADHISIVVTQLDLDTHAALKIPILTGATECSQAALPIKEAAKPIAEGVRDVEAGRDAFTFNAAGEGFLQVNTVHDLIAAGQGLAATAQGLHNFRVTKASLQHLTLTMLEGRLNLTIGCVGHLLVSNQYGSLIHYSELYDKAERSARATQPKQELGIPFLVCRALMEDGWICRKSIIWAKPNAMPESVTDRPTTAHEHIFLLTKQPRYFYDAAAILEPANLANKGNRKTFRGGGVYTGGASFFNHTPKANNSEGNTPDASGMRNSRSVWTVPTSPYPEAHFATWPEALVRPMVLAGTSAHGACAVCGAPWRRVMEPTGHEALAVEDRHGRVGHNGTPPQQSGWFWDGPTRRPTGGWAPTCQHADADVVPCAVLDPFAGSGTTGAVARSLGRDVVLTELQPDYLPLIEARLAAVTPWWEAARAPVADEDFGPLFAQVPA